MQLLVPLVASVLLAPAPAQAKKVVPSEAAAAEGSGISTHLGFDQVRFAQSIAPSLMPRRRILREIAWRRDGDYAPRETLRYDWWHKQNAHDLEIHLAPFDASTRTTGAFPSASSRRLVFRRASVVLPDLPWRAGPTQAFALRFKFDSPVAYDGKGLCIDVSVDHPRWNDWTPYALDAVRRAYPDVATKHFGGGSLRLFVTHADRIAFHCFGASSTAPVLFALGARPLPGPLHVDAQLLYAKAPNSSGSASLELPFVPGYRVYAQCVQFGRDAAPTWSPGVEVTTGREALDAWIVTATGFQKAWKNGFVEEHTMLVTEFR